jgi:hypothetical protein
MASKWYYRLENRNVGPLSSKQLRAAFGSGEITEDMLLWKHGLVRWVRARQVIGLYKRAPRKDVPLVAEPFEFQPVASVDWEDCRMPQQNREGEPYTCLQCGHATANGQSSRCTSCLGEFQLDVGKKVVGLCFLMWGLIGLHALAQSLWING